MEEDGFRRFPADVFHFPNSTIPKRGTSLTTVHTLASGSSGNALLLSCGSTHLLVDAGILNEVKCEQKDYDVAYAPAKDVNSLRVCDILEAVELFTEHPVELNITSQEVQQARGIIDEIKGIAAASESNKKIIELIDNE